ncbi:MAG TPA: hypothetical protein VMG35_22665 [Bryobacteraceae bacterium]|nr:hypothetical protein [Bryobacteraceae bacterium]
MQHLPAFSVSGGSAWSGVRREHHGQRHFFAVLILAILTAAAIGGIVIWYFLHSWISLPLL